MSGPTIQLDWAFSWKCPRCRRTHFGHFPAPPLSFDNFIDEHGDELPPEVAEHEHEDTFFMVVPGNVQCPICGVEYDVKLPRGMDEIEGWDDERRDDF